MDANSWANNRSSAAKPERRQDIFGGTFGGPLIKNTLFFFGDYQGTRFDAPGTELVSVAPAVLAQRQPVGSLAAGSRTRRPGGQIFAGNQIPVRPYQPDGARGFSTTPSLYPLPNRRRSGGVLNNYVGNTLRTIDADQADVRIDWSVSEKDKVFGRYSFAEFKESRQDQRAFPLLLGNLTTAPFKNLGVQLEPHLQVRRWSTSCASATTRSQSCPTRSTGPASATPTRGSASPAASRFPA